MNLFKFSIDAIYPEENKLFGARLIPDIDSKYFPPFHLRNITFTPDLLEECFYSKHYKDKKIEGDFRGGIVQGGYYEIPRNLFDNKMLFRSSKDIPYGENIFTDFRKKSPFSDDPERIRNIQAKDSEGELSEKGTIDRGEVSIHGFNVGQGDSLLLIANNGNSYLIDTNIYSDERRDLFYVRLNEILHSKRLRPENLKGFIVTHKHLDHLRGADVLINEERLKFRYFLINEDYKHPTKTVNRLIRAADEKIPTWININENLSFREGDTEITVFNPTINNRDNVGAPDINDSSICLDVRYGDTRFVLTGDAGYEYIRSNLPKGYSHCDTMLKISHHGSSTGTNDKLVASICPTDAFISVGTSQKYKHPHEEALEALKNHNPPPNITVSKWVRRTISYVSNGKKIFLM